MKTTLIRELQGKLRDHPEMRYSGSHFCHQDVNFGVLEEKICDFWLVITITLSVFCCTYGCNLLRYWNVCDVMIYVSVSEGPRMKSFMTCVCQTLAPVASLVTKLNFCSYCWFFGVFFLYAWFAQLRFLPWKIQGVSPRKASYDCAVLSYWLKELAFSKYILAKKASLYPTGGRDCSKTYNSRSLSYIAPLILFSVLILIFMSSD